MISDSSGIIFLSAINNLELLKRLYQKIIIPSAVKKEILIEGKQGYVQIKQAIDSGWIVIQDPKETKEFPLGEGERACLCLALELKETLILDDAYAIKIASSLGIEYMRTTSLLFLALKKKIINKKQAISLFNSLIENGYYIAPEHYAAILSKLSE